MDSHESPISKNNPCGVMYKFLIGTAVYLQYLHLGIQQMIREYSHLACSWYVNIFIDLDLEIKNGGSK